MIRIFRVGASRYLENYEGRGASYSSGGRWNLPGTRVLYFGSSPGVAMLEMANYLPSPRLVPADYRLGVFELPDDVATETLDRRALPRAWDSYPFGKHTQRLGSRWLDARRAALLFVPSVAIPGGIESSVVYNPLHPDASRIRLVESHSRIYNVRAFLSID